MTELLTKLFGSYSWFGNLLKLKTIFDKYLPLIKEHVTALSTLNKDIKIIKDTVPTVKEVQDLIDKKIKAALDKLNAGEVDVTPENKDEN